MREALQPQLKLMDTLKEEKERREEVEEEVGENSQATLLQIVLLVLTI